MFIMLAVGKCTKILLSFISRELLLLYKTLVEKKTFKLYKPKIQHFDHRELFICITPANSYHYYSSNGSLSEICFFENWKSP